jgi:hypothetical protein
LVKVHGQFVDGELQFDPLSIEPLNYAPSSTMMQAVHATLHEQVFAPWDLTFDAQSSSYNLGARSELLGTIQSRRGFYSIEISSILSREHHNSSNESPLSLANLQGGSIGI